MDAKTPKRRLYMGVATVLVLGAVIGAVVATISTGGTGAAEPNENDDTMSSTSRECEGENADLPSLPNLDFLLSGYNILRGNPLATSGNQKSGVDPGFSQQIFTSSFSSCDATGDRRYAIPDGTQFLSCAGTCSLSFQSSIIETASEYNSRLATRASVSGRARVGFKSASFSASVDYQNVRQQTRENSNSVVQSESSCCVYQGRLQTFTPPPFHPNFLAGLDRLPEEWDENIYIAFLETFGTHFVSSLTMGALFGEQSIITEAQRERFREENLDIAASASASAFGNRLSAESEAEYDRSAASAFNSIVSDTRIYSVGTPPPEDRNPVTWANLISDSPAPIGLEINRIDNLDLPVSGAVMFNLERAIDSYCARLVIDGEIDTCNPIEYAVSDWVNPTIPAILREPLICPNGHFITDLIWFEQDFLGFTNVEATCSDGVTKLVATTNGQGNPFPISCPNGFDQIRGRTIQALGEGPNKGLPGIADVAMSCVDDPNVYTATGYSNPDSTLGPDVFCPGSQTSQVIGLQVGEHNDPDGGIIRIRFLCGGDRTLATVRSYTIEGELDQRDNGFYTDPSNDALTDGNRGQFSPGEIVAWPRPVGEDGGDPVVVGTVTFKLVNPSIIRVIFLHYFTNFCAGLDSPTHVEFEIDGLVLTFETATTLDGLKSVHQELPSNFNNIVDSVTMTVYAQPGPEGSVIEPGRCNVALTNLKVGVSEVQFLITPQNV